MRFDFTAQYTSPPIPSGSQLGNTSCFYGNRYTDCWGPMILQGEWTPVRRSLVCEKLETINSWCCYSPCGLCHSNLIFTPLPAPTGYLWSQEDQGSILQRANWASSTPFPPTCSCQQYRFSTDWQTRNMSCWWSDVYITGYLLDFNHKQNKPQNEVSFCLCTG